MSTTGNTPQSTTTAGHLERLEKQLPGAPAYGRLESAGGMGDLFLRFVRVAVRPPYPWWRDCVEECSTTLRRCLFPLLISICFWTIGFAAVGVSGIVSILGTPDRAGTGITLGQIRESSYWITSMVFAGVVGSAMTADLGARKIRDELDALRVLAVDPLGSLVVPRIVALMLMAPILQIIAAMAGIGVVYVFGPLIIPQIAAGDYFATSTGAMVGADIVSAMGKATITGLLVGIVCCYKGLSAKGGAEGVGRAVNEAVLITFVALWAFGALWNQTYFALFPDVLTLRG
jgi:phospholipid/cholesterol/gamma-HCH transport system permease protein